MQGKFGAPHVMTEAFSASLRAREQNKVQTKKSLLSHGHIFSRPVNFYSQYFVIHNNYFVM